MAATPLMIELAAAVRIAGELTGGLVDGTLVGSLERAGYAADLPRTTGVDWPHAADQAMRRPAGASPLRDWAAIAVDRAAGTITRPPGVRIDSGGLVKGLLADVLCGWLAEYDDVVIDCCGDVRFGGADPGTRDVEIAGPGGGIAAVLDVEDGAVATSGTTGRRWRLRDGSAAHHLLDPSTGRPASTGLVQVSALAPTALEAEVLAKWALLSGPQAAPQRLAYGGVVIGEQGEVRRISRDDEPSWTGHHRALAGPRQRLPHR